MIPSIIDKIKPNKRSNNFVIFKKETIFFKNGFNKTPIPFKRK